MANILKPSMKNDELTKQFRLNWPKEVGNKICIALSGGIDSIVLLHLLKNIHPEINLSAIHINHNISPNAGTWAKFCHFLCEKLSIPLHIETVSLTRNGGESLENIARSARYNAFAKIEASTIALAHHQNDQVETILSQLFRGSDLHNIGAMRELSQKNGKLFWRPLLNINRLQIEAYAKRFDLPNINDESNLDTKYLRNFIRHDIIPLITNWDNNIITKILNFNNQLQNLLDLTDSVGNDDLRSCLDEDSSIKLDSFIQLIPSRQLNLLGRFIKTANLPLPSHKQMLEFIKQATTSSWEKKPQLSLNLTTILIKYKNNIKLEYQQKWS